MKVYKKGDETSYTLGVFPTIELLEKRSENVIRVIVHSSIEQNKGYPKIKELCAKYHIPIDIHDKTIQKLSPKGNCFAIGVFRKYETVLEDKNHVVLVNPMDMGNMGTMIRTMIGFGYHNLAIIKPAVDIFDPKVVRSSMGSLFHMNIQYFDSFEEYYQLYKHHHLYPFMLKGAKNIFLGGEGLFNTVVTGPGKVWLQSMPICHTATVIGRYLTTGSESNGKGINISFGND